jgi:hypothetical protein
LRTHDSNVPVRRYLAGTVGLIEEAGATRDASFAMATAA